MGVARGIGREDGDRRSVEAILDSTSDGILVVGYADGPTGDPAVVLANRRFGEIFGVDWSRLVGTADRDLLRRIQGLFRDPVGFLQGVEELYRDREATRRDVVEMVRPTPKVLERYSAPIHGGHGEVVGRIWSFRDITDRRAIERELEIKSERLGALFETAKILSSTLDYPTILDKISKKIQSLVNADTCTVYILHEETQELVPEALIERFPEEIRATPLRVGEGLTGWVAKTGIGDVVADVSRDPRTMVIPGTPEVAESLLSVPLVAKERVLGVITLSRIGRRGFSEEDLELSYLFAQQAAIALENSRLFAEVDDKRRELADSYARLERTTAELERSYQELRELDRLKSEFMQNISHELRTPLTPIVASAEALLIEDFGPLAPVQKEIVTSLLVSARRLHFLIEDLLELTRLESSTFAMEWESVDVPGVIAESLQEVSPMAREKKVTIEESLAEGIPVVWGDRCRLVQLITNLLNNAIKFSREGGRVRIAVRPAPERGGGVEFQVADEGIGIPAQYLDRIFDRFFQIDGSVSRKYGGIGLGLAIVRKIVEAHGGEIGVESAEKKGTTFSVRLRPATAPAPSDSVSPSPAP